MDGPNVCTEDESNLERSICQPSVRSRHVRRGQRYPISWVRSSRTPSGRAGVQYIRWRKLSQRTLGVEFTRTRNSFKDDLKVCVQVHIEGVCFAPWSYVLLWNPHQTPLTGSPVALQGAMSGCSGKPFGSWSEAPPRGDVNGGLTGWYSGVIPEQLYL